jgi:predicted acyl esterase
MHCAEPPGFDFVAEVKGYFDEHLRGIVPAENPPRVTWWLDGAEASRNWQRGDDWPGVEASSVAWYLAEDADTGTLRLQSQRARSSKSAFDVDYDVGGGDYFTFWVDSQDGRGLSFVSAVLDADRTLIGFPVMHLRLSADRPEPVLFAYLEELAADGSATVLAVGRLGAAYRKTGHAPYDTLGLPWHTGLSADYAPLEPGREVSLDFALTPTSRVIPAGYRLRLVVTGADPRQRNLGELRVDPPPHIVLRLGGRAGSRVDLPLGLR